MKSIESISLRIKIGYGIASLGDTAIYNLLIVYTLFFLTDVAKLSPLAAGVVLFVAMIWNALFIGVIGYISDNLTQFGSRRLPFMKRAIIPLIIFTVLMFTTFEGPVFLKDIYYMVINVCVWTAHSLYVVPYEALGAELTKNSIERTSLRSFARLFMTIGNIFGMVIVLKLVEGFNSIGSNNQQAWQFTALVIAVIAGISCYASYKMIRSYYFCRDSTVKKELQEKNHLRRILADYYQVIKLKPFKYLLAVTLFFTAANIFFSSDVLYFMKYNLSLPEDYKVIVFLVLTLCGLLLTPIYSALSHRYDKKDIMMWAFVISGVGMCFFAIIGIVSFLDLIITISIFAIGSSAYWQLIYSIVYDISEVDEWEYFMRREGILMSSSKIFLRISTAISVQMLSIVLFLFGYNVDFGVQSARALMGIKLALTYLPAAFFLSAAFFTYLYPLTIIKHKELIKNIEERREMPI